MTYSCNQCLPPQGEIIADKAFITTLPAPPAGSTEAVHRGASRRTARSRMMAERYATMQEAAGAAEKPCLADKNRD